jgi:hypothetical protein
VRLAVATVCVYLLLTVFIIASGIAYLTDHPQLLERWWEEVWSGRWEPGMEPRPLASWGGLVGACLPMFPLVALGLSGFELTLMAMPLVRGRADDSPEKPRGTIRNTHLLLVVAALSMSVWLLGSTLVTTILIPTSAQQAGGEAKYRALAYLAHGGAMADGAPASALNPVMGLGFGTIYDASTVAILALAGLSFAMTLASWIPPYLARLGMEFHWSVKLGGLVWLFLGLKFALTAYFGADVDAHRAAYLTGVLAVFAFAALAACVDVWQKRTRLGWRKPLRVPVLFLLAILVFTASLLWVVSERPVGAAIAAAFIGLVVIVSIVSRAWRSTEYRFDGFDFADKATEFEWGRIKAADYPVLAPWRHG